jgi:hypothetical protein
MGRTSAVTTTRHTTNGFAALVALATALLVCAALAGVASAAPRVDSPTSNAAPAPRINPSGPHGSAASTSYNWSGYSVSGGTYNSVAATWTQPAVAASSTDTYAAFWVGLDGDGNVNYDSVEQIGTMGYTFSGRVYYVAWYEMFPDVMQQITSFTVNPGDVLTASVQSTGSSFTLSLKDATTGKSFATTRTDASAEHASAEVIAEAPSDSSGILPLAQFGLASFSDCAINGGSLSAAGATSIDMLGSDDDSVIAATSALSADGTGFTVTDDFTAPTVTATNLQRTTTSGWKNAAVSVKLHGSDGAGGSGVAAVYYTVDGGATQTYSGAFTVSGAGSHTVKYWAVDKVGNTSSPKTGHVNLDLAAPASAPATVNVTRNAVRRGSVVAVPVTLTDPLPTSGAVTLVTRIVSGPGKTVAKAVRTGVAANATKTVRVRLASRLKKGVYTLRTTATDAAGNVQARAGRAQLTVR